MIIILSACSDIIENDNVIIDKSYLEAWQDTLTSFGIAINDTTLPLADQRAGSIRRAKENLYHNLYDSIMIQKISKENIVSDLFLDENNLDLKESILSYSSNNLIIGNIKYYENFVEMYGSIKTDSIIIIINNFKE